MKNRERNALVVNQLALAGHDIAIKHMNGRPRIESIDGSRDVSPRLTEAEMRLWLDGYTYGVEGQMAMLRRTGHAHSEYTWRVQFSDADTGYVRCIIVTKRHPDGRTPDYNRIWDAAAKMCGLSEEMAHETLIWTYLPGEQTPHVVLD